MSISLGYYPGCSQTGTAAEYDRSSRACCKALGIELTDVPDWTCCGSTPAHTVDHHLAAALSARNLRQAESAGLKTVITPCPSCLAALKTAQRNMEAPEFRKEVERLLDAPAPGEITCESVLQVFYEQLGPKAVAERVKKPLAGLRVAPYYGCLLSRPPGLMKFDDPENPVSMDRLLSACGAEIVDFAYKTECCGAAFGMPRLDVMTRLSARILKAAEDAGADCIAVACPLCQMNLDLRQGQVNSAAGLKPHIPVPYFTQLMALAFGLADGDIDLGKLVVPLGPILDKAALRAEKAAAEKAAKAAAKKAKTGRTAAAAAKEASCA